MAMIGFCLPSAISNPVAWKRHLRPKLIGKSLSSKRTSLLGFFTATLLAERFEHREAIVAFFSRCARRTGAWGGGRGSNEGEALGRRYRTRSAGLLGRSGACQPAP